MQTVAQSRIVDAKRRKPRIVFFNRSYWPDAEATGQLLTELCEDLADSFDVSVVAGQPNQNPKQAKFRSVGAEVHNGVRITRVWNSRWPKSRLWGRALNLLSYLLAAALAAFRLPRPDLVVVETDPPLLCLLGAVLTRSWRSRFVVYLQDIYPDVAIALGKIPDGPATRCLRKLMFRTYRQADRVIVISRDMRELLVSSGIAPDRIHCIANWVDTIELVPRKDDNAFRAKHGLDGEFVVMYSGNLGLSQRLEDVLEAAHRLRRRADILFLLVGDGAARQPLEDAAARRGLANVRFLGYEPKSELSHSLSAADLHLVPVDPRVASCLMPSKLYGILAVGRPLLAIAPEDCELAEITAGEEIGVVGPPCRPEALAEAICWGASHRGELAAMGRRARSLAEDRFDRRIAIREFEALFSQLLGPDAKAGRKERRERLADVGSVPLLDRCRGRRDPIGEIGSPAAVKKCHTVGDPPPNRATSF